MDGIRADSDQIAKARRISEIAEREKKATKGPWLVKRGHASADRCDGIEAHIGHTHPPEQGCWDVDECPGQDAEKIVETDSGFYGPCANDAEFIAHARADIPFLLSALASERQAVIEDCAKMADQIAQSCSACSYSREKQGEEPSFCENFGCSSFADLAAAIRSME